MSNVIIFKPICNLGTSAFAFIISPERVFCSELLSKSEAGVKIEPGEGSDGISDAWVVFPSEAALAWTTVEDPASFLARLDPLVVLHRKAVSFFHCPPLCRDPASPDFNCSTLTSATACFQQGLGGVYWCYLLIPVLPYMLFFAAAKVFILKHMETCLMGVVITLHQAYKGTRGDLKSGGNKTWLENYMSLCQDRNMWSRENVERC